MDRLAVVVAVVCVGYAILTWRDMSRRSRGLQLQARRLQLLLQRRRLRLSDAPQHLVTVPPGPDGRPGEQILAPSLPAYTARIWPGDVHRQDFGVMVGKRSIMQAVCLGKAGPEDTTETSAVASIAALDGKAGRLISGPFASPMAGEDGHRIFLLLNSGHKLTEWHFIPDGWRYAVGIVWHLSDQFAAMQRAEHSLRSWRWIEPATG